MALACMATALELTLTTGPEIPETVAHIWAMAESVGDMGYRMSPKSIEDVIRYGVASSGDPFRVGPLMYADGPIEDGWGVWVWFDSIDAGVKIVPICASRSFEEAIRISERAHAFLQATSIGLDERRNLAAEEIADRLVAPALAALDAHGQLQPKHSF